MNPRKAKLIESMYPLSPLQEGLLFHRLRSPGSGEYFEQMSCSLHMKLDTRAFKRAWSEVIERHSVLRTAFNWKRQDKPFQVVYRKVALPLEQQDWRGLPAEQVQRRIEDFLAEDRRRDFDLDRAPLTRLALLRIEDDVHHFVWSFHHLLLDGWSLNIVFKEFLTFFETFRNGREARRPRPRPYREYIAWLMRQDLEQAEAFWRKTLDGITAPTPLPHNGAALRPTDRSQEPHVRESRLSAVAMSGIESLARRQGLTLNTLVLGAWALVLSRYSREDDVLFGSTVSGRPAELPGVESMVGLFINTLPVRVRVSGATDVLAWLRELQEQQVETRRYEYSPLVEIQGWSRIPRELPFFESLVVFESRPVDTALEQRRDGGGLQIRRFRFFEKANYPLSLTALPGPVLGLRIFDNTRHMGPVALARLLGHVRTLLEGMALAEGTRPSALPMLTRGEHHQILSEWNDTRVDVARGPLHDLFEMQARVRGDAVAVVMSDQELSYGEIDRRADRLARRLRAMGVGPEARVGVFMQHSPELTVALLAILKAGGAYVPFDPAYPAERLKLMAADMSGDQDVPLMLTARRHDLPFERCRRVNLDTQREVVARDGGADPVEVAKPENSAYVMYTSGSTGRPKGVVVSHAGVVNLVTWHQRAYGVTEHDRATQVAPLAFDASVLESWPYLCYGARLHLAEEHVRSAPETLLDWLAAQRITLCHLATPLAEKVLTQGAVADLGLKALLTGGDRLHSRFCKAQLPFGLFNHYGPTESTVLATRARVSGPGPALRSAAPDADSREPAIGRPLANLRVYLLDDCLEPVPAAVPGLLRISGVGLARGYQQRPGPTARSFLPDPFRGAPGRRMYDTGDLARLLPDGNLEFLGRLDHQVKIRGLRIELGEIEVVLGEHPDLKEVAVAAREGAAGPLLVAYVVARGERRPGTAELRRHLRARLPETMVPPAFVELSELPRNPSGKLDRRRLPAPEAQEERDEHLLPVSPIEELLAAIWTEVLGVDKIERTDNFFTLGGHSLNLTQVVSRLSATLGVEPALAVFFEKPTLAELAAELENRATGFTAPPITPVSRRQELPLSFTQQRLWFLDQLAPGQSVYNNPTAIRLNGVLDVAVFGRCLDEIVRRHEILRTRFATVEGRARQVVHPPARRLEERGFRWPLTDLGALAAGEREAALRRILAEAARRPFDLRCVPLLRVNLVRLTETEHAVSFVIHHIVSDGWSMGVLVRELVTLYKAFSAGRESPLAELPIQYADFAHWQREWLRGDVLEAQISAAKTRLEGAPALLDLPTDRPRPVTQSFRGARRSIWLPKSLAGELEELSRGHRVTLFMTLLAAFKVLLARTSGQEKISVGTTIANRDRLETESMIGFFANTLVLYTDLAGSPSFRELLQRVRTVALDSYAHRDLPFERLVEELRPERNLSYNPLIQVMFVLQNAPKPAWELPELALSPLVNASASAMFDLNLSLFPSHRGWIGSLDYKSDLFDATTAGRMLRHLRTLLETAAADPAQAVAELAMLAPAERHQVLLAWNDTRLDAPGDPCLHELFEAQVKRSPHSVAVVAAQLCITFHELNGRANRLAHHLRKLGVGPEVPVGLSIERSPEMITAILAILKAGGVYVPVDPALPDERLALILEDARIALLLAERPLPTEWLERPVTTLSPATRQESLARQPVTNPATRVRAGNLAYVIYTSGSTGRPKGVMVSHRGIVSTIRWRRSAFSLNSADNILQTIPVTFDPSLWQIFGALLSGARLTLMLPAGQPDSASLVAAMAEGKITVSDFPPSMLRTLLDEPGIDACTSLKSIFTGGEAMPPDLPARFYARLEARLHNIYGPTESSIDAAVGVCESRHPRGVVPIGRPIANRRILLLSPRLRAVAVGIAGELCIGGTGLARGYLGAPAATAERFVPHPFSARPAARLYRTGDLAYALPDGRLVFRGRADHQVKIRGVRVELGEVETVLGSHPSVLETTVTAQETAPGQRRLVAYVVPARTPRGRSEGETRQDPPSIETLRGFLAGKLPESMIPSLFLFLETLPRTPGGKVDRRALPDPASLRPELSEAFVKPRNAAETTLAEIWAGILGIEQVGVYDNFFSLGGDSILSIQIVSRARQAGLVFTPKLLFEHQTIAELAQVAQVAAAGRDDQAPVVGPAPLSPVQRWFFEQHPTDLHHFNQALLLSLREPMEAPLLERATGHLFRHHDALRLRFSHDESGWRQIHAAFPGGDREAEHGLGADVPFFAADLSGLPEPRVRAAVEAAAVTVQSSLCLSAGPIGRFVLFELGALGQRLLLVIHHLAVDGVSWRILLEDLVAVYVRLSRGEEIDLPPKTTSFKEWTEYLVEYAASSILEEQAVYWLRDGRPLPEALPVDFPHADEGGIGGSTATSATVAVTLDAKKTRELLRQVPEVYRTQVNDVLLTALAQAFTRRTGDKLLWVDLEGHGRDQAPDTMDFSHTVGWFTSVVPVVLDLEGAPGPKEALRSVKEQLRRIPDRGLGYGILRYLNEETAVKLARLGRPQLSFNYLGQLDSALPEQSPFLPARESSGPAVSPRRQRTHRLAINGGIVGGRLQLGFTYSAALHRRETIERLARGFHDCLEALIAHCLTPQAGGYTPSDFALSGLDQEALDRLLGTDRGVEDLYPLSPMQEGMLFHTLYSPGSGVYFQQLACDVYGELDVASFRGAWEQLIGRHSVLRTSFLWEGLERPLQRVSRQVELPWRWHDWRALDAEQQARRLEDFLVEDRRQGFDLSRAPLLRLTLIRLADDRYRFVWSQHHLLADGWCLSLILNELLVFVQSQRAAKTGAAKKGAAKTPRLAPVRPFRDYIGWLEARNLGRAESFWRAQLDGFSAPTPLPLERPRQDLPAHEHEGLFQAEPAPATLSALQTLTSRHRLTLSTLVQGAWALLLNRYSGQDDVVFGTTVSGRPADLPGIESMIGLFINTLPARVRIAPRSSLLAWLRELQDQLVEMRQYEFSPLLKIQGWSDVPRGSALFRSLLVYESYPVGSTVSKPTEGGLRLERVDSAVKTNYPLTLLGGPDLSLQIKYDRRRFADDTVRRLLSQFHFLLEQIAATPDKPLGACSLITTESRHLVPDPALTLPEPRYEPVTATVADWAERLPQQPAVRRGDRVWTYRELARAERALRATLSAYGVAPADVVAIHAPRCFGLVAGALAILGSGAVLCLIDRDLPERRQRVMLREAGARFLLYMGDLCEEDRWLAQATTGLTMLHVDPESGRAANGSRRGEPSPGPQPGDAAYLFFTSGTTAVPRGVLGCHKGLSHFVTWQRETFAIGPEDRGALSTALSFDVVLRDLFLPLTSGATLCLPRDVTDLSPNGVFSWLERDQVTMIHTVPAVAESWLAEAATSPPRSSLRWVFFAGEPLRDTLVERWRRRFPQTEGIVNLYGPTETSLAKCCYRVPQEVSSGVQPVGIPLPQTQALVLAEDHRLCGIGEPGEIVLRTPFRSLGYVNATDEDSSRFFANPFSDDENDLLYRTGDRGRYRGDGGLEILGRLDHQIKIRGVRLEPDESAAVLLEHPDVESSVVMARRDAEGRVFLAAYLVAARSRRPASSQLRSFLGQRLPAAMVPEAFVVLDRMPLTANGKIDRRALPEPAREPLEPGEAYVAPRDALELQLTHLWEVLFDARPIGVRDNFFDLGGHSLTALRLMSMIKTRFDRDLPLAVLFETGTIEGLSEILRQKNADIGSSLLVPIQPQGNKQPLFCLPPLGGEALRYLSLARHLGSDQPVYGLQAPGLDREEDAESARIEDHASRYIEAIRTVQSAGPYRLAGWSFGGIVALEMAQQLKAEGQEAMLYLIDSAPPDDDGQQELDDVDIFKARLGYSSFPEEELRRLEDLDARLALVLDSGKKAGVLPADLSLEEARRRHLVFKAHLVAAGSYLPAAYEGRALYFQAADTPISAQQADDRIAAWKELITEGIEIVPVPGDHSSLMREPQVRHLAQRLRAHLEQMDDSQRQKAEVFA